MSWWNFPARDKRDVELAREIDAHLEHETELNVARGMSREDAHDAAKRKLGNETRVREDVYEMNTARWLDSLWQDLKYGARTLRKNGEELPLTTGENRTPTPLNPCSGERPRAINRRRSWLQLANLAVFSGT